MDINKRKKLLPWLIVLVIVLLAALVLAVFLILQARKVDVVRFDHSHVDPAPKTGQVIDAKDDYVLVAESDDYKLYYYEPQFSIKLENKNTGAVLESTLSEEKDDGSANAAWTGYMKSGIVFTAIRGTTNTYQVDMNTVENEITTWAIDNGFYAVINFKGVYDFTIGVEVKLEGDELVVRVPDESIKEEQEDTYISTVSLFPFLGYTHLGDENGYMLVPDGNGALIYLTDKEGRYSTGFSGFIYGTDEGMTANTTVSTLWEHYETVTEANNVLAPVFGMAHTDDQIAYLGIVEKGDERASIEVAPNGVMVNYNRCFARFLLRDVYTQPLSKSSSSTVPTVESDRLHSDLQVRYHLLSGDDADYSGMATAYREYLLANGMLTKKSVVYNTRVDFLGTERENFLMGTTSVPMTTVKQMEDIFAELRRDGVGSVMSVYRGWQNGGLYNLPIKAYKADGKIGGTNALTKLIKSEAEKGNAIYLFDDALSVNSTTNSGTYNVMKMVNKRTFEKDVNGEVYDTFYYLMPDYASGILSRFAGDLNDANLGNLALGGITEKVFSYSSKGSFYSRTNTKDLFDDALRIIDDKCSLILETPNAYLWKYADAMINMPLGSSDYLYIDQEIPFLSMVLKGSVPMYANYVNFEANKTENFLEMVESGLYPSFYITAEDSSKLIYTNSSNLYSLEFDSYRGTIAQYDAQLRALAELTGSACIVEHQILDNGLVKVTYENGVTIYVNYSGRPLSCDGVTVDALSYKVGE